jgi:hypothetical protein
LDQLAHRVAPIALARAADEIARGIVHGGNGLVLVSDSGDGNRQVKIPKSLAHAGRTPEPPHKLPAM